MVQKEMENMHGDSKVVACMNDIIKNSSKVDVSDYIHFACKHDCQQILVSTFDIQNYQTLIEKTFRLLLSISALDPTCKDDGGFNVVDRCYNYRCENYDFA